MRLKTSEIDEIIKKPKPGVSLILFYGPDIGLASSRCNLLIKNYSFEKYDPFSTSDISVEEIESNPFCLINEALTISLFNNKRLIKVNLNNSSKTRNNSFSIAIKNLLDHLPVENSLILIEAGDIKASSSIFSMLSKNKHAALIPCYIENKNDIYNSIKKYLSSQNTYAGNEEINLISSYLGNDHLNTINEIDKLCSYVYPRKDIKIDDIEICLSESSLVDLEKITYSCFLGDRTSLIQDFENFINSGKDCIQIIKSSQRNFNSLLIASFYKEKGLSTEESIKLAIPNIFWKIKPIMIKSLNLWTSVKLEKCINKLLTTEEKAKKFPSISNTLTIHTLLGISSWVKK